MSKERLTRFKKLFSAKRAGSYFLLGAIVLVFATYGAWRLQQLFSPNSVGDTATTRIQLRSSDRNSAGTPLQNSLNGSGTPYYDYNATVAPTVLPGNTLFRIQGDVFYKDK